MEKKILSIIDFEKFISKWDSIRCMLLNEFGINKIDFVSEVRIRRNVTIFYKLVV